MLPRTRHDFVKRGLAFQRELDRIKQTCAVPDYGWYPYQSLSALSIVGDLLNSGIDEIAEAISTEPVADLGCGDGDLALFFAHMGHETDAIDHAESNYNQMRGVELLRRELRGDLCGAWLTAPVNIHDIDLDKCFELPRKQYGLVIFLGTLYHLKNPFYVMEELAGRAAFCVVSTRIAQVTCRTRARIAEEPVAYLLDAREANNDPTNFWIFSEAGLLRLLDRAGWMVRAKKNFGCLDGSNPVEPHADERIFLLLKSRIRYPGLHVRPLEGWHQIEQDSWRWTMQRFSIEVVLPKDRVAREFALKMLALEAARVACYHEGEMAGAVNFQPGETVEFRGRFPESAGTKSAIVLDFEVDRSFAAAGDRRELGILIPHPLPFRIS